MIAVVLTVGGSIFVALLGALFTFRTARMAQTASPYTALAERVVKLEESDATKAEEITKLKAQVSTLKAADAKKGREIIILRGDVQTLGEHHFTIQEWIDGGAAPPPPQTPVSVLELLQKIQRRRPDAGQGA